MENNIENKIFENNGRKKSNLTVGLVAAASIALATAFSCSNKSPEYVITRFGVSDIKEVSDKGVDRYVQYNGMVNDKVFAVSNSNSNDQYYAAASKKMHFYGQKLDVLKVTPDSLVLGSYK
jgi:hypothetical protein